MLALNVTGVISITKALLPHFLQRGAGQIMVTSSVAGKVGSTISASYSASKHAIQGYFNALRSEVGFRGISVHLACPGPVATPIQEHAFAETAGAKVDTSKPDTTKRMTAARCAHLMAVQLHHGVYEAWMAPQPILLFTALGQYMPTLFTSLQTLWYGPARVKAFRSGDMGYSAVNS
ncbi:DHRS7, partial [Symbiodinium sp. KB8]